MEALDYPENISEELDILVKKGYYPSKSDLSFLLKMNSRISGICWKVGKTRQQGGCAL